VRAVASIDPSTGRRNGAPAQSGVRVSISMVGRPLRPSVQAPVVTFSDAGADYSRAVEARPRAG